MSQLETFDMANTPDLRLRFEKNFQICNLARARGVGCTEGGCIYTFANKVTIKFYSTFKGGYPSGDSKLVLSVVHKIIQKYPREIVKKYPSGDSKKSAPREIVKKVPLG